MLAKAELCILAGFGAVTDLGWIEDFSAKLSVDAGPDVAVLIRHIGFDGQDAFGFAYGTLTNHAESGFEGRGA
jgi:hypothetical protein